MPIISMRVETPGQGEPRTLASVSPRLDRGQCDEHTVRSEQEGEPEVHIGGVGELLLAAWRSSQNAA